MSAPTSPQKNPLVLSRLNTNCSQLNSNTSLDQVPSPSSTRSGTLARLRLGGTGVRRSKSLKPLARTRSEGAMSVYSDATTIAEPAPPLPTSASELTLAHSVVSSGRSIREESPISMARSFMYRSSRILLKKSNKSSLSARTLDWMDETQAVRGNEDSAGRIPRHRGESEFLKQKISQPFNFQHIAHTVADEKNFHKVGSHSVTPSRELKGIKTRDLFAPIESNSALTRAESELRLSKSMDSFKRISRSSFSTPYPPIVPPPRRSSRRPPPLVVPSPRSSNQESPTIPDFMLSGGRRPSVDSKALAPKSPLSISTGADDSPLSMMGIAQAVTTPDESACVLKSELASPLEDVPEEETLPNQLWSAGSPRKRSCDRNSTQRMVRSGSDPVLPEGAQQNEEIPVRASRHISGHVANGVFLDLDWDEDIDYCYDQLESEGFGPELGETESPVSDADILYIKERRRSHRLSRQGVPPHLQRASSQVKQHGLGVSFPPAPPPAFGLSPSLAVSDDYVISEKSQGTLPLFTPDMAGDVLASDSPRSSVSQMSKYPSGGSSHAVGSNSSKRTSGLAVAQSSSTISVPDLVPSSKRKSTSTKRSSIHSQGSMRTLEPGVAITTPVSVPTSPKHETSTEGALLEPPRIPLRKRSFSDSASKTFRDSGNKSAPAHVRSISHVPSSPKNHRPYTLFPPLDRIGAASKA